MKNIIHLCNPFKSLLSFKRKAGTLEVAYQDIHKEIIELSKAGNSKAQYQLYRLYSKAMYNICYRMMNNKEEAEDMLQDAFTEAFINLKSFRFESSFGAWLKRIVVNKCINSLKKKKAELVFSDTIPDQKTAPENENFETSELKVKEILNALEKLPHGYRVIFSLYMLEGYDHAEIAEIMGITESTSKSQFSRAKLKIKELLIN
ncbi:MAG: RNA polymerase sigma factor [Bacteroidales bacterium]|nr:RNA polymerase sigma factor [Bacteroidales bacterium]